MIGPKRWSLDSNLPNYLMLGSMVKLSSSHRTVSVRATLRLGLPSPILAREIQRLDWELWKYPTTHLAREIQREYSRDHLARVNYLCRLPDVTNAKMAPVAVKAEP